MSKKAKTRIAFFAISFILFVTCVGVSLHTSGKVLQFGWKKSTQKTELPDSYAGSFAICDRDLVEKGFPLTFMRPYDDVSDCTDQYNGLAIVLDLLIALALSLSIGWAIIKTTRKTSGE